MRAIDMTGRTYGHLTAIEPTGRRNSANNIVWRFLCSCGNVCEVDGYAVRNGCTKGCMACVRARIGKANSTHGASETSEFGIWTDIQTRCYNNHATGYSNYGGRGIRMCEKWRDSFTAFLADVGPRPSPQHSIDRIDNNGHYEPGNVRWATRREQGLNRRTNVNVEIRGETKTASEWAISAGIAPTTVLARIRRGWNAKSLLLPVRGRK